MRPAGVRNSDDDQKQRGVSAVHGNDQEIFVGLKEASRIDAHEDPTQFVADQRPQFHGRLPVTSRQPMQNVSDHLVHRSCHRIAWIGSPVESGTG